MKTLISSAAASVILIIPLTTVEAAQESRNFNITPAPYPHPTLLAGPFDAIRRNVDEVDPADDDLKGRDTQPASSNQPSAATPAITSAPAQGSPDNPIPITSNEVQTSWSAGNKTSSYYYTFIAAPGELRIIFDVLADSGGAGTVALVLRNEDWKELVKMPTILADARHNSSKLVRHVRRFRVDRRQKIIIHIDAENYYADPFTGTFRVQLERALKD